MASDKEVVAAIRVLVAVAHADNKLAPEEISAIQAMLEEAKVAGVEVADATAPGIDLDAALAAVTSEDLRHRTYTAAAAMAMADNELAPAEEHVLHRIRGAWRISDHDAAEAREMASLVVDSGAPATEMVRLATAEDDALRLIRGYSVAAIALGAFPIPAASIVADIACVVLQKRLIAQVANAHGKALTNKEVAAVFGAMAGLAAVRIAVGSLLKLVPFWGWIAGGASAFVTTWALGMAVHRNLARGGSLTADELKRDYQSAKGEGETFFTEHKDEVLAEAKSRSESIAPMSRRIAENRASDEEILSGRPQG